MKVIKTIYALLMFLPLIATLIALQFLPVPGATETVHGAWNAPYEPLLVPLAGFLFGWLLFDIIQTGTKNDAQGNKVTLGLLAISVVLLVFAFFTYQGLANQFTLIPTVPFPRNLTQLFAGIVAIILLVYANVVPRLPMKAPLGLKTRWSMVDEIAWRKSQVGLGLALTLAGVILVVLSVYLDGLALILLLLAVIILAVIAAGAYSYKVAQEDPF